MRRHVGLQYERHGSTAGSGIRFEWRLYRPIRAAGRQRSTMLRRRTILQEPKEFPGPFQCAGRSAACALRIGSILATRSLVDCAVADIDNSPFGMPSDKTRGTFSIILRGAARGNSVSVRQTAGITIVALPLRQPRSSAKELLKHPP